MRLALLQPVLAGNSLRERFDNPVSIKSLLLFGAIIAVFIGLGIAFSVATNKRGEKTPQNQDKFFDDDVLETKKLERTLSVALLSVAVVAVSIALYYVWEPTRQAKMSTSFDTRSVRRGQTLFANESMVGFSNVQSLGCANCHGGYDPETGRYASGGTANFTLKSLKDPETDEACAGDNKFTNADCVTVSVPWEAPALNTALYKYPIRKAEVDNHFKSSCKLADQRSTADCRSQVYDILMYGRPGTPMPAWGVAGGGPKNEQAIDDLVNFIISIQLPADEAAQPIRSGEMIKQKKKIVEAEDALEAAKEKALESGTDPKKIDKDEAVVAAKLEVSTQEAALEAIEAKTETEFIREDAITKAQTAVDSAQKLVDLDAPAAVASAQSDYDNALAVYRAEPALKSFGNPQDYLDQLEKDQTEINIEKKIEEAKVKNKKSAAQKADAELVEVQRVKNIVNNLLESRDALATAKATQTIFAPESLKNSKARLAQVQSASDGQVLFESNCARCHTKGWSYFTPSNARIPLAAPQGTGAFGPNLSGGGLLKQFVTPNEQFTFIGNGSIFQAPYGARGIGSGRMPGFNTPTGRLLSDEQINAIVQYEREELKGTGSNSLGVRNLGSGILTGSEGTNDGAINSNSGITTGDTKSGSTGASNEQEGSS